MSQTDIRQQIAQRRIKEFERKFGRNTLHLAYHAALPVALNSELLHLLRINFFLDPPQSLPYMAEIELLLSPLCQEIGEDLYEIDSTVRDELLKGLVLEYGHERLCEVAGLLWEYTERRAPWADHIRLERAQQLTALNFLEPETAKQWLEQAEKSVINTRSDEREWFVAMRGEIKRIETNLYRNVYIEPPSGSMSLDSKFYIERQADTRLKHELTKTRGLLAMIRGSRQTGKTLLLMQGIHYARQNRIKVVHLDLQSVSRADLETYNRFLRYLAEYIVWELKLDLDKMEQVWGTAYRSSPDKLSRLLQKYVLPQSDKPILLAIDEADRLLQTDFHTDFFGLIRSWYNRQVLNEQWRKLNIVLLISTEPHLLIADPYQSPFNVGFNINLQDFNEEQVRDLNERHGSPVTEEELPQLMALLGGQPYLTRQALYTLVTESLSWAELSRIALTDQGPFASHLRHYQWLLHDQPALKAALREVIEQNRCSDKITFYRLRQAGLVIGSSDACTCRCELYRMYFKDKL